MVYMEPRKQALPMPQRSLRMEFIGARSPISIETPSIFGSRGHGRGVQGEHSNGGQNSAIETGRPTYARNKPWKK